MAFQSYSTLGFSLLQELGSNEIIETRACMVNPRGRKHEIISESSFNLKAQQHLELESWKPLSRSNHSRMKPIHETRPEEVFEFLWSRADKLKVRGFDMSCSSLLYLNQESMKPVLDLMMHNHPESSINSEAHMLFSSSRGEFNDVVSIAADFHMSKNSARWRKLSRLVPQFQRRFDNEVLIDTLQPNTVNLDADTLVPLKSPENTRVKSSPKKHNPKMRDRVNDLYERNHLRSCESLISLMLGNEEHRQTTMLSLKKSCGDLSQLLTQFSIAVAGTGIAVFFSVACSVASRQVPFCANKVFESALSLSLVLLSWAVNRLREAILDVNRKGIKDKEMTTRIERRFKDVYFRAATVVTMVALRFG